LLRSEVYLCKDELFEKEGGKPHVRPDFRVFALDYRYVTGPMSFGYTYNFPDLAPPPPLLQIPWVCIVVLVAIAMVIFAEVIGFFLLKWRLFSPER
jgi:hypothetical protein